MSPNVRRMEYAVRGQVVIAADAMSSELKNADNNNLDHPVHACRHPFDHIVYTNIGNPQSVGQKPLTWPRQVLALVDLPDDLGVSHPQASQLFPTDAIRRAKEIKATALASHSGSSGAYSHSKGALSFRQDVVAFLQARDGGVPANPEHIFLTNGASSAIDLVLTTLIASDRDAIMIPIPQYPIYSALIARLGGRKVPYYLDEERGWSVSLPELQARLANACVVN